MAFIFQKNQREVNPAERSGDRTDKSLGPARYDSMVDSIKGAFTSRFRRQRPFAAEDTLPEHSLAGMSEGQETHLETGIAHTETEEGTDVHTALLRTEGTTAAEEEEARAEEEERKRKMRLLRLRTEEEEENVDVDLYHFRRQWTYRPRYSIVLFKLFLSSFCVLLNIFHLLHAFNVFPPTLTVFSLHHASYQEAVDISRTHLKQMLRDRVGIVARWSKYGDEHDNEEYDGCFVLINNNVWSEWAPEKEEDMHKCGEHLYTRYRMLRIFLSPTIGEHTIVRCPHTIEYRWQWSKACCPQNMPSLEHLQNLANGDSKDMICTQKERSTVNASMLPHICHDGTQLWSPLPQIIALRNSFIYTKPTVVRSYELQHKIVLQNYWIGVTWQYNHWLVDGKPREIDLLSRNCGNHCFNMTLLLSNDSLTKFSHLTTKFTVCVKHGRWKLIEEESSEECVAICAKRIKSRHS
ncbi:hypothetical protein Tcan_10070 [Toxocara canis]|uniref:Uncharacterized protein n=1 Tax=Toxocara canis TaxID=6265 RepID=A0A0B2VXW9_TOXCA|nr:hypothetical protein Tcan_10070 [Toxocara canis]